MGGGGGDTKNQVFKIKQHSRRDFSYLLPFPLPPSLPSPPLPSSYASSLVYKGNSINIMHVRLSTVHVDLLKITEFFVRHQLTCFYVTIYYSVMLCGSKVFLYHLL